MAQEETHQGVISVVAQRYAQALFELAHAAGSVDSVSADLRRFNDMAAAAPDLRRLMASALVSAADQANVIEKLLAKMGMAELSANFLRLITQKRRLAALPEMITAFDRLSDDAKGVVHVQVISAQPLSAEQAAVVEQSLNQAISGKAIKINASVDPSIIGGLIVKLGSRMIDTSLKTKINALRTRMKEVG